MKNISSTLFTLVLFGLAVAGLALLAWPESAKPEGGGSAKIAALSVSEQRFDFGAISMSQGTVSRDFLISNISSKPVTLSKLYTSCMCTNASFISGNQRKGPFGMPGHGLVPALDAVLGAGESATVEVTFDPAAHGPSGVGLIERSVLIETDQGEKLEFSIKAKVTP